MPISTALYIIIYIYSRNAHKSKIAFSIIVSLALFFCISSHVPEYKSFLNSKEAISFDIDNGNEDVINIYGQNGLKVFIPFHKVYLYAQPGFSTNSNYAFEYTRSHSILHYAIAMFVYHYGLSNLNNVEIQESEISPFISFDSEGEATKNLILILVESLESWPLFNDELAQSVIPNLHRLVNDEHTAYFSHITSMVRHGVSGDGQMMLLSGLLPIQSGAACMLYGDNEWPGIPHLYDNALIIDPANGIWNQHQMSEKYGFTNTIEDSENGLSDELVFTNLCQAIDSLSSPYCILAITCATHSPFHSIISVH